MGVFDQAARYAARAEPGPVLRHVLGEGVRQEGWFDTRPLPMPGGAEREPDLVPDIEDGEGRALLLLEFQAQHDPEKLDITLLEAATLRVYARHGEVKDLKYRVGAALVYLKGECPDPVLLMAVSGKGTLHECHVWNVCRSKARDALDMVEAGAVSWGELFWVPLMEGGTDEDVVRRWADLVGRLAPTPEAKAALRGIALVFAELAGKVPEWRRVMGATLVTESEVVNEWMDMVRLESAKKHLRRVIQVRLPDAWTPDVEKAIADQPSLELLEAWDEAALAAESPQAFLDAL
ncbi:MAG: hypothetical protein K2W96_15900, partial [Gemmataceae bacterium]|nr:hypothetical protein [Gemmataceae bacterium]